jgi:hypothetical protein
MICFIQLDFLKVVSSHIRNQIDKHYEVNHVWNQNILHDQREIIFPHELDEYLNGFWQEEFTILVIQQGHQSFRIVVNKNPIKVYCFNLNSLSFWFVLIINSKLLVS